MAIPFVHANAYLNRLFKERTPAELGEALQPKPDAEPAPRLPRNFRITQDMVNKRWALFPQAASARQQLLDPVTEAGMTAFDHNIENFIGTVKLPVGLAGPLRVNGLFAQGNYYVRNVKR